MTCQFFFIHRVKYSLGQNFRRAKFSPGKIFAGENFRRGKFSPGKIFVGENFRRGKFSSGKIFVGENFRHLTKISSLFPDEVFPDKVFNHFSFIENDNISAAHIWRDKLHLNENGTIVLANNFIQRVNPKNIA